MNKLDSMKEIVRVAVENALAEVGIERFKMTSLFLSNERVDQEVKRAA
ncbi:hypothetical protein G6K93_05665 [Agrobacterium rhizogenes]|nr:hypothetical protein [Rhizobium rhizogenes]NTJ46500.1 hypothetical protein [Rhizobium rhizogenes]